MSNKHLVVSTIILGIGLSGCGGGGDSTTTENAGDNFVRTKNTLTVNDSGLTWQDNAEVYTLGANSDEEASKICKDRRVDNYDDWRLPTKTEAFKLYSQYRSNLSYTYEHYSNESNADFTKLRHLTWTSFLIDGRPIGGSLRYGAVNEVLSENGATEDISTFSAYAGFVTGKTYSIRCVRDNGQ